MLQHEPDTIVDNAVEELLQRAAAVNLSRRDIGALLGVSSQAVHNWAHKRYRTDNVVTFLRIIDLNTRLATMSEGEQAAIRTNLNRRKRWVSAMVSN
ncbi:MAG: hypothetical protein ACPGVG_19495 [Mycobacterium sp.]